MQVLFCHAAGFCADVWAPVIAELTALARRAGASEPSSTAIDLPGHGKAGREPPPLPLLVEPFRDAVLRATAGAEGPTVGVGHSLGGTALVLAELARPGTFDSLMLYEPIIFPPWVPAGRHEQNPLSAGAERRRDAYSSADEARAHLESKPLFAAFEARALDGYLRGGLRAAAGGGVELCCDRRFEADIYRMDLSGIWARLSELRCPVHIWCGGESRHMDALGPGGSTEALYAKMAGAAAGAATRSSAGGGAVPLEVLGGLGHFGPLEDPGRFAKCLWERAGGQESTIRSRL